MSLSDRAQVTQSILFLQRLQMAVASVSLGLALGVVAIPDGLGITLAQCGKLTRAVMENTDFYTKAFASAVVNHPALTAVIDTRTDSQTIEDIESALTDDVLVAAATVTFFSLAAGM